MVLGTCLGLAIHHSHAFSAQVHDGSFNREMDWKLLGMEGNGAGHLPPAV